MGLQAGGAFRTDQGIVLDVGGQIEALAHGLPVIATNCGGPAEILVAPAHGTLDR